MNQKALPESEGSAEKEMDLFDHLRELRKRLLISTAALLVGAIGAFCFAGELFHILSEPYYQSFPKESLIGTGPAEAFILKLKLAMFVGAILVSPVIFHQAWLFVAPGLYDDERKLVVPFVACSTFLFLLGVTFCYLAVLPLAFDFFHQEYGSLGIAPAIRVSEHLSMMTQALLGFGLVFELPVLAFFLGRAGVITDRTLIDGSRYAIVIIFIISAVLTPPDVLTQFLMAGPLLLLYGLSILILRYSAGTSPKSGG